MNYQHIFQKLVSLLGRSENDLELKKLFAELGEKFPLDRPDKGYTRYLLEDDKKKNRGYHLGMCYIDDLPEHMIPKDVKEKELFFFSIQDIKDKVKFKDTIFPFGITWDTNPESALELLGKNDDYDLLTGAKNKKYDNYYWVRDNVFISLIFTEQGELDTILYSVP